MTDPSLELRLYGTEEAVAEPVRLEAGALSVEFESGNLRHVRWGGREVIRAVSFVVRDRNWGTYGPRIDDLAIERRDDGFRVGYRAVVGDDAQSLAYEASIEGSADGRLVFRAKGVANSDFVTNRTGFVVLHPIDGVAGRPAEVEHVDGKVEAATFPELIDPLQPMMNLRAITHHPVAGLAVTCRMEGDTYEMEDQRNWTDASYKTYVRPLAAPWPYTLAKGEALDQAVTVTIAGRTAAVAGSAEAVELRLGAAGRPAPKVGLGFDPAEAAATRERAALIAEARPAHLLCHYDPAKGHDRRTLAEAVAVAAALGAVPWLEAVIVSVDDFEAELAALGRMVAELGSPFATVLVSPAADLKSTLPGSPWPPAPEPRAFFAAARAAFPGVRLGGGVYAFFAEFNRKRPPVDLLDVVDFTTIPTVHAGDDRTVMENLETLTAIAASAGAIAAGRPWIIGPSAIGMRMNPYGAAPMPDPNNVRRAMNHNDPRQRGLFAAAWAIGHYAGTATGGADAVTFGGTTGAQGLVHAPASWPQPWYDEAGGVFPIFHALRGLAGLAGRRMLPVTSSLPGSVAAVAVEGGTGVEMLLANTGDREIAVRLPFAGGRATILDADGFGAAAGNVAAFDGPGRPISGEVIRLGAYAVARVVSA